jgi:3-(3-hydroxy-phenyl)propionate hydroxylase
MTAPATIWRLLAPWIAPERCEIRRAAVYQFHAATAARWREGRVLLAGDAAHQTPPFLGQGLNAGIRDVVNLAWKLPLVLSGAAPESLVDSYAAERDAHAHELVDWAVAVGRLMEALADAEAGTSTAPPPDDLMRSGYGQGRTAPPLRRGLVIEEQVSDTGVTGYLFSQPTVRTRAGSEVMLDHLLGRGFSVVARSAEEICLSDDNRAWLGHIGATIVDVSPLEVVRGSFDRLFASHGAAIVRPDRYVFGVTDGAHNLDQLVERLKDKIIGTSVPVCHIDAASQISGAEA